MLLSQLAVPRSWKADARVKVIGTKISRMRSPQNSRTIKSKLRVKETIAKVMMKSASLINITEQQVRFNTNSHLLF